MPSSPAENVQHFYDDITLGNKGVGRMIRVIDASGESAFSYDPRGNMVREACIIAGQAYVALLAYDAADNLVTLTYPSGRIVSYTRDALGRGLALRRETMNRRKLVGAGLTLLWRRWTATA